MKIWQKHPILLHVITIVLGFILLITGTNSYIYLQSKDIFASVIPARFSDFAVTNNQNTEEKITVQYSIFIPKINVSSQVAGVSSQYWYGKQWQKLEQVMQKSMNIVGAVSYPHSVLPGNKGNIFITGHSSPNQIGVEKTQFNTIFERVPELLPNDEIYITQENILHKYVVQTTQIVSPNKAELLKQTYDEETLVLITCYPVGSTKDRFIIRATKVSSLPLS